jgi:hypothetical protein
MNRRLALRATAVSVLCLIMLEVISMAIWLSPGIVELAQNHDQVGVVFLLAILLVCLLVLIVDACCIYRMTSGWPRRGWKWTVLAFGSILANIGFSILAIAIFFLTGHLWSTIAGIVVTMAAWIYAGLVLILWLGVTIPQRPGFLIGTNQGNDANDGDVPTY